MGYRRRARGLVEKLVHRHPHVFGDVEVSGSDEVLTNWERLKAEEGSKPRSAVDDDIPVTLPALARAAKVHGEPPVGSPVAERRIGHRLAPRGVRAARRRTG